MGTPSGEAAPIPLPHGSCLYAREPAGGSVRSDRIRPLGGGTHHGGACAYSDIPGAWATRTWSEQAREPLRNACTRTQDAGAADPADAARGRESLEGRCAFAFARI